ncbi:MAG: DUF4870 domain-containing protein [Planctomycetaceae bacterium]|nr:DUF4870 domain-containing protein [Planctomycetaceae bacterium]
MSLSDEIERLQRLHDSGTLSDEEFAQAKANLLNEQGQKPLINLPGDAVKWWAVGLHLSQFAGYLVPLAGFVVPIVLWQINKEQYPELDEHGRNVANWIISQVLYFVGCIILALIGVGIALAIVLAILGIVFPIIGAIRAADGRCWKYPLTIEFLT